MIFAQIGTKRIVLDGVSEDNINIDDIRIGLSWTNPEVKNAEVRQKEEDGDIVIEFMAKSGRKG